MNHSWQEELADLTHYIEANPAVSLRPQSVSILEEVRPEFNRRFDLVREAAIKSALPQLLPEVETLSLSYFKVAAGLSLSRDDSNAVSGAAPPVIAAGSDAALKIALDEALDRFLRHPAQALNQDLFNPLFDLLQGNLAIEAFEKTAAEKLQKSYERFYCAGYERWLAVSLLSLLGIDATYKPEAGGVSFKYILRTKTGARSTNISLAAPQRSNILDLTRRPQPRTLATVDALAHGAGQYLGVKFGIEPAAFKATGVSGSRPWVDYRSAGALEGNFVLIYLDSNMDSAALVADETRLWQPDILLDIKAKADWSEAAQIQKSAEAHSVLQPGRGTFILPIPPVTGAQVENLPAGVTLLAAGFDGGNLAPLAQQIMASRPAAP